MARGTDGGSVSGSGSRKERPTTNVSAEPVGSVSVGANGVAQVPVGSLVCQRRAVGKADRYSRRFPYRKPRFFDTCCFRSRSGDVRFAW